MKCQHGFHMSLSEDLSPVRNGKPNNVCPICGRNKEHEHFIKACIGLGINPKDIDPNENEI